MHARFMMRECARSLWIADPVTIFEKIFSIWLFGRWPSKQRVGDDEIRRRSMRRLGRQSDEHRIHVSARTLRTRSSLMAVIRAGVVEDVHVSAPMRAARSCSFVRRPELTARHKLFGGVFPGRDQACLGIGRRSKSGIQVRRELKVAPPWPKLTLARLPGRQAGDVEREDERPQQRGRVSGVFPGRDQDCLGIARRDDQSLGSRALKSHLLGQT